MHPVILGNVQALEQLQSHLAALTPQQYAKPLGRVLSSAIGRHVRHILDHYTSIEQGLGQGTVNYDLRQRDTAIETDLIAAQQAITALHSRLQGLASEQLEQAITVQSEVLLQQTHSVQMPSSIARELMYVSAHTVHHLALIAAALRDAMLPVDVALGVAPATGTWDRQKAIASA